ncbi:thioredoxin domain-containing protein [Streptomyces hygroscopicus subsp. hygroscopicus]|uniref:Protein-disulfide isomerase n=1 Tax=Streptomyces demainii TaxID=588122 RepID=A0ABT9KTH6_9ACTN|nr:MULTISPECIES: thioredoxin domain-containing protein [Streptomyces]MBW8092248.1 thioredoxin domain-containing protein [Streptomyces hygroscopicus subsp. hygroscopicus]MDP9610716.1 protein-disulfide isomerase [Streptomyces demainii]
MSQRNREGKRGARERLREQRERERARAKRKRTLGVLGAVVAVFAAAGAVGMYASTSADDSGKSGGSVVPPRGAVGKGRLVIPSGKAGKAGKPEKPGKAAPATLTVYEDFRCPGCKQFEDVFRTTVHELQDDGRLRVEYHLVTIIDGNLGGTGSLRAANAAACAQDRGAGAFRAYHDVLYRHQAEETRDVYADNDRLIKLADTVPGLVTPAFRKCVEDGRHDGWVRKSNDVFAHSGYAATPTVLLDGKSVYGDPDKPLSPNKLKRMVLAAARD